MKYFIIISLFFLCFTNQICSSECNKGKKYSELKLDSCRKYISYEFGLTNLIDIYIAEGDTICDVLILDGKGDCISTTCPKSPILKWAFSDIANEITESPIIVDNNYKPYYYKLSIIEDGSQTILSSSTLLIDYRCDVKEKIEGLRDFIIRLWYSNCIKETVVLAKQHSDKSFLSYQ